MGQGLGQRDWEPLKHPKKYENPQKHTVSADFLARPKGFEPLAFWSVAAIRAGKRWYLALSGPFYSIIFAKTIISNRPFPVLGQNLGQEIITRPVDREVILYGQRFPIHWALREEKSHWIGGISIVMS